MATPLAKATPHAPMRFAILASGRGSNAMALLDAFESGFIPAHVGVVISNKADAEVLSKAAARGYATQLIEHRGKTRAAHEQEVLACLRKQRIDHILLAGYMRIVSADFLREFSGKVLNIHPALLPDFPGLHAAEQQWQAGRKVVGATVHFVDAGVDTGQVILQGSLIARGDESADALAHRLLHEVEHLIYPRAVRLFLERMSYNEKDNTQ